MSRRRPCRTCRLRRAARPRQAQGRPARRRAQAASRRTPSARPSPPRRPCARRPCALCSPSAGCPRRPLPRGARAARALHAAVAPAEAQGLQLSAADAGLSAASRAGPPGPPRRRQGWTHPPSFFRSAGRRTGAGRLRSVDRRPLAHTRPTRSSPGSRCYGKPARAARTISTGSPST